MIARLHLLLFLSSVLQTSLAYFFGKSIGSAADLNSYRVNERLQGPSYCNKPLCMSSTVSTTPISNLLRDSQQKVLLASTSDEFQKHGSEESKQSVKLGVLFLNLGGPESVQVIFYVGLEFANLISHG